MKACNTFCGNPSNSRSHKKKQQPTNVNLKVVQEEKSEDHQSHQDASSRHHECQDIVPIHPVDTWNEKI